MGEPRARPPPRLSRGARAASPSLPLSGGSGLPVLWLMRGQEAYEPGAQCRALAGCPSTTALSSPATTKPQCGERACFRKRQRSWRLTGAQETPGNPGATTRTCVTRITQALPCALLGPTAPGTPPEGALEGGKAHRARTEQASFPEGEDDGRRPQAGGEGGWRSQPQPHTRRPSLGARPPAPPDPRLPVTCGANRTCGSDVLPECCVAHPLPFSLHHEPSTSQRVSRE